VKCNKLKGFCSVLILHFFSSLRELIQSYWSADCRSVCLSVCPSARL